jgi:hypothetical protein
MLLRILESEQCNCASQEAPLKPREPSEHKIRKIWNPVGKLDCLKSDFHLFYLNFFGAEDQTQGLGHAKHTLHH